MINHVIKFVESFLIIIICSLFSLVFFGLQILSEFIVILWFEKFICNLGYALSKNESTFITIAAIFIGIYFTIYTLLGSIKVESTFASIRKENFIKLVRFIKFSFVGAFVYLFYSIFNTLAGDFSKSAIPYLTIFSALLLIYMLLSALRLGFVVYLVYENDLKNIHELIEKDKKEKNENKLIMHRLSRYLAQFEDEQNKKQAEFMQKQILNKKQLKEQEDE